MVGGYAESVHRASVRASLGERLRQSLPDVGGEVVERAPHRAEPPDAILDADAGSPSGDGTTLGTTLGSPR
jgi:hypothetical protein